MLAAGNGSEGTTVDAVSVTLLVISAVPAVLGILNFVLVAAVDPS